MRFLLYNIRYGAGIGTRLHFPFPYSGYIKTTDENLKNISNFIASMKPDIIGLVEVDIGSFRSYNRNQVNHIARAVDHQPVSRSKYARDSIAQRVPVLNKQGNALMTSREIISRKFHYLNNGVKRLVIEIELKDCSIFLVHLSLKYRHRQHQLAELATIVNGSEKPAVAAGDFNVFRGSRELDHFLETTGLISANERGWPSHPSRSPKRQLDYILHSPEIRTAGFAAPQVTYSDHIPLVWDFSLDAPADPLRKGIDPATAPQTPPPFPKAA